MTTGQGTFNWADGNKFTGQVLNGKREGFGAMKFSERSSSILKAYSGLWVNDLPNGKGTIFMRNGETYHGDVSNFLKHGNGSLIYAKDDEEKRLSYVGEWNNDVMSGFGNMTWKNQDSYEGDWSEGKRSGKGNMKFSNGQTVNNLVFFAVQLASSYYWMGLIIF